jgi:hypothetical protein
VLAAQQALDVGRPEEVRHRQDRLWEQINASCRLAVSVLVIYVWINNLANSGS